MVDTPWLKTRGLNSKSVHDYVARGWLERVVHGVYCRPLPARAPGDYEESWAIPLLSLQWLMKHAVYLGGDGSPHVGYSGSNLAAAGFPEARSAMKIISWNLAHRHEPWRCLLDMDIDLALVREAGKPPPDVAKRIKADPAVEVDCAPWETKIVGGRARFRTAIVKLSNRIEVEWIETKSIDTAEFGDLVRTAPSHSAC